MTGNSTFLALGEELAHSGRRPQCSVALQACQKCRTVAGLGWSRRSSGECRLITPARTGVSAPICRAAFGAVGPIERKYRCIQCAQMASAVASRAYPNALLLWRARPEAWLANPWRRRHKLKRRTPRKSPRSRGSRRNLAHCPAQLLEPLFKVQLDRIHHTRSSSAFQPAPSNGETIRAKMFSNLLRYIWIRPSSDLGRGS